MREVEAAGPSRFILKNIIIDYRLGVHFHSLETSLYGRRTSLFGRLSFIYFFQGDANIQINTQEFRVKCDFTIFIRGVFFRAVRNRILSSTDYDEGQTKMQIHVE
jgi:hypothetical protein